MSLIKILLESEDIPWDLYERKDELMAEMLHELSSAESDDINQSWKVANFNQVQRIWNQYADLGFVRDKKNMEKIAELFIDNTLKIINNTELAGHTSSYPLDHLISLGIAEDHTEAREIMHDKWDERIYNYIYDEESGQMRISDYALKKLGDLTLLLDRALNKYDHEMMLRVADRFFNVIHRRSDISKWYIEGGSASLDRLFEE